MSDGPDWITVELDLPTPMIELIKIAIDEDSPPVDTVEPPEDGEAYPIMEWVRWAVERQLMEFQWDHREPVDVFIPMEVVRRAKLKDEYNRILGRENTGPYGGFRDHIDDLIEIKFQYPEGAD